MRGFPTIAGRSQADRSRPSLAELAPSCTFAWGALFALHFPQLLGNLNPSALSKPSANILRPCARGALFRPMARNRRRGANQQGQGRGRGQGRGTQPSNGGSASAGQRNPCEATFFGSGQPRGVCVCVFQVYLFQAHYPFRGWFKGEPKVEALFLHKSGRRGPLSMGHSFLHGNLLEGLCHIPSSCWVGLV